MTNYLVTGGAGFIGSHLVEALEARGDVPTVIDTKPAPISIGAQTRWYLKSITEDLNEVFRSTTFAGVFHLTALPNVQYSIEHPDETNEVNYEGTIKLLDYCANYSVPRFVFSSSAAIYGDNISIPLSELLPSKLLSPYAKQKFLSEQACHLFHKNYGFRTTALRYFNVYGPRQSAESDYASVIPRFFEQAIQRKPLKIYGDGMQTRDFISVSDVVAANLAAMESSSSELSGKVINIGSGEETTILELARQVMHISNTNLDIVFAPQRFEPRQSVADISLASQLLNWKPRISLPEGLQRTYDFYRAKSLT